jgi:hypothetical protein
MTIRSLFGKKKKTLGFTEKKRTREEINQEYNHHAVMFGHISRIICQNQKLIDLHMKDMERLNEEGAKLPPEQPADPSSKEIQPDETTPA